MILLLLAAVIAVWALTVLVLLLVGDDDPPAEPDSEPPPRPHARERGPPTPVRRPTHGPTAPVSARYPRRLEEDRLSHPPTTSRHTGVRDSYTPSGQATPRSHRPTTRAPANHGPTTGPTEETDPMPEMTDNVLSWATDIEETTLAQAAKAGRLPFVDGHVALMADAHVGMGATVGSVIPTRGAIIPSAVGVDIGCGMIAAELPFTSDVLGDDLTGLHARIAKVVPAGVGRGRNDRDGMTLNTRNWPRTRPRDVASWAQRQVVGAAYLGWYPLAAIVILWFIAAVERVRRDDR